MKILLVDEWGAGNSIRLANDITPTGASVYILREFNVNIPLPRNAHLLPPVSLALEDRLDSIDRAVKKVNPDVIMPMEESTLFRIWDRQPSWLTLVQPRIDLAWLDCYRDKHKMLEFARQRNVPVPETYIPASTDPAIVLSYIEKLGLPVVIKGSTGSAGEQVRVASTIEEALKEFDEIHSGTNQIPALQKFIDGPTYQVGGLFDNGRPICFMVGEKVETLPPVTGPAIKLESCEAPELADFSMAIMSALGISGMVGLDFIRGNDGQFYFLEINPRIWGSYGFARALDIDMFEFWHNFLQGIDQPTNTVYPIGVQWVKMPEYLFTEPQSRGNMLKRLSNQLALKSLAWRQPYLLLHQLRRIYWAFRK